MGTGENTGENLGENTGSMGSTSFLEAPTGFTLSNQTQNRMTASWTAPSKGGATEYRVYSNINGLEKTVPWGTNSVVADNLSASTNYTMWGVTSDGTNESGQSNPFSLQTNPASGTPSYIPVFKGDYTGMTLGQQVTTAGIWVAGINAPIAVLPSSEGITDPFGGNDTILKQTMSIDQTTFGGRVHDFNPVLGEGDEVWYRWYEYFPAGFQFANGLVNNDGAGKVKWTRWNYDTATGGGNNNPRLTAQAYSLASTCPPPCTSGLTEFGFIQVKEEALGNLLSEGRWPSDGGAIPVFQTPKIPNGQWIAMQMYMRLSAGDVPHGDGNAVTRIWANSTLVLDVERNNLAHAGSINFGDPLRAVWRGDYWNGGCPANQHWYMTEDIITTQTPDGVDASGNAYIDPQTSVGDF